MQIRIISQLLIVFVVIFVSNNVLLAKDSGLSQKQKDRISHVNQAIMNSGANWIAGETSISHLSEDDFRRLAGGKKPESGNATATYQLEPLPSSAMPRQFDWRNVNGTNFVTPVRNQLNCGSCFVFATVGALESQLLRDSKATLDIDLSEQIVLSCANSGSCDGGSVHLSSDYLVNTGTGLESCYPYTGGDGVCGEACTNWKSRPYKIKSWSYVNSSQLMTNPEIIKTAIYTNGPVITQMISCDDLQDYSSGIYTHVSGECDQEDGGHSVLVVGWDDDSACFIVKNSWGSGWGEDGYFRIMYSELSSPHVRFGEWTYQYEGNLQSNKSGFFAVILNFLLGD